MRIGYFGTYDTGPGYPRNDGLIAACAHVGHEVIECHAPLWKGNADKLSSVGGVGKLRTAGRMIGSARTLSSQLKRIPPVDRWVVGALGIPDILGLRRKVGKNTPIILDAFFSIYEAIVEDRRLWHEKSLKARAVFNLESRCIGAADAILTDTAAHADYLSDQFGVKRDRFFPIPVGSRLAAQPSLQTSNPLGDRPLEILFVGTYIPLHGIQTILEAEAICVQQGFPHRLTMLGTGQLIGPMREMARGLGLDAIRWIDRLVNETELIQRYNEADLVLGIFGDGPKAARVVPCKVYDALACGRPMLTANHPVLDEYFAPHEIARCDPNADALAESILELGRQPEALGRLAASGSDAFRRVASFEALGKRMSELFDRCSD